MSIWAFSLKQYQFYGFLLCSKDVDSVNLMQAWVKTLLRQFHGTLVNSKSNTNSYFLWSTSFVWNILHELIYLIFKISWGDRASSSFPCRWVLGGAIFWKRGQMTCLESRTAYDTVFTSAICLFSLRLKLPLVSTRY